MKIETFTQIYYNT